MSQAAHLRIGAAAEDAALHYLKAQGLDLLERNYRCRYGELDLIMRAAEILVFVEVRYRSSIAYGGALASIGDTKQRRLTRAAECYLVAHPDLSYAACRFDAIAVRHTAGEYDFNWLPNAF